MITSKTVYKTPHRVLIDSGVTSLPVSVGQICSRNGWMLASYDSAKDMIAALGLSDLTHDTDGFCLKNKGRYYIFYNRHLPTERQRFVIAHEIGHITLGHVDRMKCTLHNQPPSESDNPDELAANLYAARLVAPAPVLHAIHATTPEQIADACSITITAAKFCAKYITPENELIDTFSSYIRRIFWQ